MNLSTFRTLGHSGLVVSPLALGTMTFGNVNWGSDDDVSKDVFTTYVDAGGNFIDTADVYSGGRSEELTGRFIAERKLRDNVVLATKFAFNAEKGNPNAGGNGRENIYRALYGSLRRLKTDYLDLYWLHVWDMVTPVEETLQTLGDLVRAGHIRYFGFSDMPAWYATKAATLSQAHNVPGPIATQLEYSLVARQIESGHIPAALECGLASFPGARSQVAFWRANTNVKVKQGVRADSVKATRFRGRLPSLPNATGRYWTRLKKWQRKLNARPRRSLWPGPRRNPA